MAGYRWVALIWLGFAAPAGAENAIFDIRELPVGRSVTLPNPALTRVPAHTRVKLTSTDSRQTLKLLAVSDKGRLGKPLRVGIYDSRRERVQYVNVTAHTPAVYIFKSLSSIQVVPEPNPQQKSAWLKIESNRPLGIAR